MSPIKIIANPSAIHSMVTQFHGPRFTGKPAYFRHVISAASELMEKLGDTPHDYDYAVFHQPNA